eukprot:scaffold291850_cov20-Tisochrysis_lutea.AAC.2
MFGPSARLLGSITYETVRPMSLIRIDCPARSIHCCSLACMQAGGVLHLLARLLAHTCLLECTQAGGVLHLPGLRRQQRGHAHGRGSAGMDVHKVKWLLYNVRALEGILYGCFYFKSDSFINNPIWIALGEHG